MIAGAGEAGQAILMAGQQIAERTFLAYSRTVEASADQAGVRFLTATHQSGVGMLQVFKRFQDQEILSSRRADPFAQSHPASADRIASLQDLVDASPYRDIKDSPETIYAFDMMRAKLRGYIQQPEVSLRQYPVSNTSKPARYARAMAYFKTPDMAKALGEIEACSPRNRTTPISWRCTARSTSRWERWRKASRPTGAPSKSCPMLR